jgi:hypothetical protein
VEPRATNENTNIFDINYTENISNNTSSYKRLREFITLLYRILERIHSVLPVMRRHIK